MKFRFSTVFLVLLLVVVIGLLAYFLGKKNGAVTVENIALNETLVKEIAELSTLEIRGTATVKNTNLQNDGTLSDNIKRLFMERTMTVSIPYIAKYGVDLQQQKMNVSQQGKTIQIHLPEPQLLSYELILDKANTMTKAGWLNYTNSDYFNQVQSSLYVQTKKQMEEKTVYKERTEAKIVDILKKYYHPTGYKVAVSFDGQYPVVQDSTRFQ